MKRGKEVEDEVEDEVESRSADKKGRNKKGTLTLDNVLIVPVKSMPIMSKIASRSIAGSVVCTG